MHINGEGILCAYAKQNKTPQEGQKAIEISHLKVKYNRKVFNWPEEVGLEDLKHVGDTYDFHLIFPYESWLRRACSDAMACKVGQRLFVKCLKLFLIDNDIIKSDDRDKVYS